MIFLWQFTMKVIFFLLACFFNFLFVLQIYQRTGCTRRTSPLAPTSTSLTIRVTIPSSIIIACTTRSITKDESEAVQSWFRIKRSPYSHLGRTGRANFCVKKRCGQRRLDVPGVCFHLKRTSANKVLLKSSEMLRACRTVWPWKCRPRSRRTAFSMIRFDGE